MGLADTEDGDPRSRHGVVEGVRNDRTGPKYGGCEGGQNTKTVVKVELKLGRLTASILMGSRSPPPWGQCDVGACTLISHLCSHSQGSRKCINPHVGPRKQCRVGVGRAMVPHGRSVGPGGGPAACLRGSAVMVNLIEEGQRQKA